MNSDFPIEQVREMHFKVFMAIFKKMQGHICQCDSCNMELSFHASTYLPCTKCGFFPDDEKMEKIKAEFEMKPL